MSSPQRQNANPTTEREAIPRAISNLVIEKKTVPQGSYTAVFLYRISKESDVRYPDGTYKTQTKAMWSFCRFLHFISTNGGLNSSSERSEVVNAEGHSKNHIAPSPLFGSDLTHSGLAVQRESQRRGMPVSSTVYSSRCEAAYLKRSLFERD